MAKKGSRLEAAAEKVLLELGLAYQQQYRFHEVRRWRSDFRVWRPLSDKNSCLVEIEGVTRFGAIGRHQTASGYEGDLRKYAEATRLGWTIFRFSEKMIEDRTMEDTLRDFFGFPERALELGEKPVWERGKPKPRKKASRRKGR